MPQRFQHESASFRRVCVVVFSFFFFFPSKSRLPVKSPDKISSKSTRSPNKTLSNEIKISRLHINYEKKKKKKEKNQQNTLSDYPIAPTFKRNVLIADISSS